MDAVKEFIERETGEPQGFGMHLSFDEMGLTPKSLAKSAGKVGLRAKLTEFYRAARRKGRQQNPIAPNQADIVKWIIYDRYIFAANTQVPTNYKYFTVPIGTNGKTKADTNMEQVQRLPDPLWYNTEGLGFYFAPTNAVQDVNAFLESEYMEYWVGAKTYLEGPIQAFPAGAGLWGSGTSNLVTNGTPRIDNIYDMRLPAGIHLGVDSNNNPIITDGLIGVTILQGQQFKIEMQAPLGGAQLSSAGTGLTVRAFLYGILSRGVQ